MTRTKVLKEFSRRMEFAVEAAFRQLQEVKPVTPPLPKHNFDYQEVGAQSLDKLKPIPHAQPEYDEFGKDLRMRTNAEDHGLEVLEVIVSKRDLAAMLNNAEFMLKCRVKAGETDWKIVDGTMEG